MSFEAYLRNIEARTGKTPGELRALDPGYVDLQQPVMTSTAVG